MSEFSIMLEEKKKKKDVQISELARYCGIDRKNLFRLLQGKENLPEEDVVQKMSLFMKLMQRQVLDLIQHFPESFKPTVEGNIRELHDKNILQCLFSVPMS